MLFNSVEPSWQMKLHMQASKAIPICLKPMAEQFLDHCVATPDAEALWSPEGSITFKELRDRAFVYAKYLTAVRGIHPLADWRDRLVVVMQDLCIDTGVWYIATLLAGGILYPVDNLIPPRLRQTMLHELRPKWVVSRPDELAEALNDCGINDIVTGDVVRSSAHLFDDAKPQHDAVLSSPVTMAFTSGSSGRPKGAMCSQLQYCQNTALQTMTRPSGLGPQRCVLSCPATFDVHRSMFYSPILGGGCTLLPKYYRETDPPEIAVISRMEAMLHGRATQQVSAPKEFAVIIDLMSTNPHLAGAMSSVRSVWFTGEPLTKEFMVKLYEKIDPECTVYNWYGMTEYDTVALYKVPRDLSTLSPPAGTHGLPLGYSAPGSRVYVLEEKEDGTLRPCNPGEPGVIYLIGATGATRYFNAIHSQLRVINLPLSLGGGLANCVRTGDRAMILEDGLIYHCGRLDLWVKVGGVGVDIQGLEALGNSAAKKCIGGAMKTGSDPSRAEFAVVAGHILAKPDDEAKRIVCAVHISGIAQDEIDACVFADLLVEELQRDLPIWHDTGCAAITFVPLPQTHNNKANRELPGVVAQASVVRYF